MMLVTTNMETHYFVPHYAYNTQEYRLPALRIESTFPHSNSNGYMQQP